jgi:hypothetical protein
VVQRRLEQVAEAALLGVGVAEVAAHEAQGELLEQLVGRVGVADTGQQVAIHRRPIPLQDHPPGAVRLRGAAVVRLP